MKAIFASALLFLPAAASFATSSPFRRGQEFVPRAGYKRTVDLLAMRRAREASLPNALPSAVTVLRGWRTIPVILLEYSNRKGPFSGTDYAAAFFGLAQGATPPVPSLTQYYLDHSLGMFRVDGSVLGWYSLPELDTYYEGDGSGSGVRFGELLSIGLAKADAEVDFGRFDNDGPDGKANSGDDDGFVDTVLFIHAETGGECGNQNVWSHSWYYSEPTYGHGGPYVTNDVRKDLDGRPVLGPDGSSAHVMVEDYTIQPGLACGDNSNEKPRITPIGVLAHEYGHALGLPDLYDRTPRRQADSEGIGGWCLMAGGSWGFDGNRPNYPSRLGAWALWRLGWAHLQELQPGWLDLEAVADRNRLYLAEVPTSDREYFLMEVRDPTWEFPSGQRINWDKGLPAAGLAIWHVDESVGASSPNWPFAPLDAGQNDAPSLPQAPTHSLVALEQRDCRLDLENRRNGGDDTDLWNGPHNFGAADCGGNSTSYEGKATGFAISNINLAGQHRALVAIQPRSNRRTVDSTGVFLLPDEPRVSRRFATSGEKYGSTGMARSGHSERETVEKVGSNSTASAQVTSKTEYSAAGGEPGAKAAGAGVAAVSDSLSDLNKALVYLKGASAPGASINVIVDPATNRVRRITGLALDVGASSRGEAAKGLFEVEKIKPIFGVGTEFEPAASNVPDGPQRFFQVLQVEGRKLPVFSQGATVFYAKSGSIAALSVDTVDPYSSRVLGRPGDLGAEKAQRIAAEQLALSAERAVLLRDDGEGVYLVDGRASWGRVARKLVLPAGQGQKEIAIYVDSASKTVLTIE